MRAAETPCRALCILGMHRSGTSTVARAMNFLDIYLGEKGDLGTANEDNPEGYWERPDITRLQTRLLNSLGRGWDAIKPLPEDWITSPVIREYQNEIRSLVAANFTGRPLWGWKDPRTCLLLPLWRQILEDLGMTLVCVFAVRSPLDVAASLKRRDNFAVSKSVGIWFNYNLAALRSIEGLPVAFLNYDRLIENWEPELRRCSRVLGLDWPVDETAPRKAMSSFIRPKLRHSSIADSKLGVLPLEVRELYELLLHAANFDCAPPADFYQRITRIAEGVRGNVDYAFSIDECAVQVARPSYARRTWWRWKRSINKRIRRLREAGADRSELSGKCSH